MNLCLRSKVQQLGHRRQPSQHHQLPVVLQRLRLMMDVHLSAGTNQETQLQRLLTSPIRQRESLGAHRVPMVYLVFRVAWLPSLAGYIQTLLKMTYNVC